MSKQDNLHDFLVDIADAVREKKGTSDPINAQNLSEEIKNLPSGASPFAVDFGEEIASGNPAYMGALQEDIDYYNEVVRSIESGERTQDDYLTGELMYDFRARIAWWPKGWAMVRPLRFANLRTIPDGWDTNYFYQGFQYTFNLISVDNVDFSKGRDFNSAFQDSGIKRLNITLNASNITALCSNCSRLQEVNLVNTGTATSLNSGFMNCFNMVKVFIDAPSVETANNIFQGCKALKEATILTQITSLYNAFNGTDSIKYLTIDISKVTSITGTNNFSALRKAHLNGLQANILIPSPNLELESVKYILDHCQAREDGAAYTLTLHADVLARFMNKCTEGNEEYDAEYAASLASANEKGLTLA